jgi:DNA-binding cell septation regulator SpoVG
VISMKRGSFKDYVHDVLSEEFPELIKNLRKEYKMLSEEFEIA